MDIGTPNLSVIIPLDSALGPDLRLLRSLQCLPTATEIIFVSSGGVYPRIQKQQAQAKLSGYSLKWLCAAEGNSPQLNTAAAAARGKWLWFLRPGQSFDAELVNELQRLQQCPDALIFCRISPQPKPLWLHLFDCFYRKRSHWLHPVTDQGLCLRKVTFSSLGGFPPHGNPAEVQLLWQAKQHAMLLLLTNQPLRSVNHMGLRQSWQNFIAYWQLQRQPWPGKTGQLHQ